MNTKIFYPSSTAAWYMTSVLFLLYWLSLLDRLIISLLVDPIKKDLGISDFELSLLQGFAFGVFYAVCGLPLGWIVDRFSRRWIIFTGVSIWTIATALCGVANNYWQLFLARIGVGAGESALSPAAYSLMSDSFPPDRLTTALSMYSLGSLFGTGMAYVLGGVIINLVGNYEFVNLPLIGNVRSWQMVFILIGLPGVFLGLLVFTFKEPVRIGGALSTRKGLDLGSVFSELFGYLWSNYKFFFCHHAGFTLCVMAVTGLALWAPAYLSRSFSWQPNMIGIWLGGLGVLGGVVGAFVFGKIIDRRIGIGQLDAHMRVFSFSSLLSVPVVVLGVLADNPYVFIMAFFISQILVSPIMGISAAALQLATPSGLRGRVSSVYLFVMILLGIGLGPSLVAGFTDFVFLDDSKVGYSIALLFSVVCPLASFLLYIGRPHMYRIVSKNLHIDSSEAS